MAKVPKRRAEVDKKVDANKLYSLPEALALVKDVNVAKFDASVDLHVRLGIDPRKADQASNFAMFTSITKANASGKL